MMRASIVGSKSGWLEAHDRCSGFLESGKLKHKQEPFKNFDHFDRFPCLEAEEMTILLVLRSSRNAGFTDFPVP